ncbi:MAG: DUF6531 domain-containing protein [Chitinophagaceae bacterium]|nr:DUF6531 domain-containing protein [Chitinophagaceae bacterium]
MFSLYNKAGNVLVAALSFVCSVSVKSQNINMPNKKGPLGTQVNTFSGNLHLPRTDVFIPARGFNLNVTFYYNSFDFDQNTGFGNGWSFGYNIRYKNDTSNSKTIIWGDNREDTYTALSGGSYKAPGGFFNTLSQYQADKFLLTETNGTKYYFDNSTTKKITRMQERNGNYIIFNYSDSLLTSIVNNSGQTISFTYNSTGKLAAVVDAVAAPSRTSNYNYDGSGNLNQVTDPMGGTSKYTYLVNGPMKTLTDKNNNTIDIIYFSNFAVSEIIGCNKRQSYSYDTTLKKTVMTDYVPTGSNQVTTYEYEELAGIARLISLSSNCCGYNMRFEFDDNGNKIKQVDANGNTSTYTYDSKGNLLTMKDALNRTMTYTYSANFNNISSFTDPKGNVYSFTYNSNGDLTQITEPGNLTYTATYNTNGDIISSTNPKGNIFSYNYDSYGNPKDVTGPGGYHGILAFDPRSNLLSYTDSRGNINSMEYDILNRLKKFTDPLNNNSLLSYDATGNITSITNPDGEIVQLTYDASNRRVETNDPLNNKSITAYDAMDNVSGEKDELGNWTTYAYDERNRLSAIKDALGNEVTVDYDANGNPINIDLPNGQKLTYSYDNLNRATSVNDNSGTIASVTYDYNGNVISYTNGTGATIVASYDSLNRVKQITDPLGNSSMLAYDNSDNIVSVTDRNGFITTYTYDGLDRVKTFTDNNGSVTTASYDAAGNIVSLKDGNNNITSYNYDNLNRVTTITYPDGKFMQFTYDKKANAIIKRLADGTNINFTYDSLNRIILKTLPDGQLFTYTYDAAGRVLTATNNSGIVNFTYDVLNRITSETFDGRTTKYSYNISGRTQTTIYPDSTNIIKTFDTRNRLISVAKGNGNILNYEYNNADQVSRKTFVNGIVTNFQFDFANRLSNFSTAGGAIQNTAYTYDKEYHKKSISRINTPSLSEEFNYDNGYRLINYKRGTIGGSSSIQNTYNYDAVGNRAGANFNGTNVNYTNNILNQLTNSNNGTQNINFTFNNNGNLSFDGFFYKIYDAEGRLIKDSSAVNNVLTYQYDALNRRVRKVYNGASLKYTYSGFSQIEERDGITNSLRTRTVFSNFISPVVTEKNNNSFYYHQNEVNSVEAITDNTGTLAERYQYNDYGKQTIYNAANTIIPSSVAGNRFGFTGQEYDSANGSNHFYFRDYNPVTGTFNQRDPLGYGDGMGMYQYVHNNPANGIDIFGLDDCDPEPDPQKNISDHLVDLSKTKTAWWLGMLSNLNSVTTVVQGDNGKTLLKTAVDIVLERGIGGEKLARSLGNLRTAEKAVNNSGLMKFLNGGKIGGLLAPVNILGTAAAAVDLGNNWGTMNTGQRTDGVIGLAGSSTFARISTTQIINGVGARLAGGTFAEGFTASLTATAGGFVVVAAAGGAAIFGTVNEAGKYYSGKSIAEVSYEYDIPLITGTFRVLNGGNYTADPPPPSRDNHWKPSIIDCPNKNNPGGPRKRKYWYFDEKGDSTEIIQSNDPNEILGPDGVFAKKWVSVTDRLPYTILYENSKSASAPAKYVRITTPIEPKQDPATFQLGSFGFNNLTFAVPNNTASYYQRLDLRDSLGLYVDVVAGYDQLNKQAFWQFESIDPRTLVSTRDPLKGFLLLQDSANRLNGHGFVNFSMKPLKTAVTLDTIAAKASIVFDGNDTIPTNIHKNTIDAVAPASRINDPIANNGNSFNLTWTGADDASGSGIDYYTVYASGDKVNYSALIPKINRTDTAVLLNADSSYCFFVLATDKTGNKEVLRPNEIICRTSIIILPINWLYFNGKTVEKNNILEWATSFEKNSKQYNVERSLDGTTFSRIGMVKAAGNSSQSTNYQYKDYNIDRLPGETTYYRLKQINIDGTFTYSNIIKLTYKRNGNVRSIVYPNPTEGSVMLVIRDNTLFGSEAGVYDINGKLLEKIKITSGNQIVSLGKYLAATYFIKLKNGEVLKVIKH